MSNEVFQSDVTRAIDYLAKNWNWTGLITKNLMALRKATFKEKSRWRLLDRLTILEASTTFSSTLIHLSRNWYSWTLYTRSANLLHESVHLLQARNYTSWGWKFRYALSKVTLQKHVFKIEKEAYDFVKKIMGGR